MLLLFLYVGFHLTNTEAHGRAPNCSDDELPGRPGIVRTVKGATATFWWETRNLSEYRKISCSFTNNITTIFTYDIRRVGGLLQHSSDKVTNESKNATGLGFHWYPVSRSERGVYFTVEFSSKNGAQCSDEVVIYLYDTPTEPQLTYRNNTDMYKFTCQANATSVPSEHRQPLVYTWRTSPIGNSKDFGKLCKWYSGDHNETLTLDAENVTRAFDLNVTCQVTESGSNLSSAAFRRIRIDCVSCVPTPQPSTQAKHTTTVIVGVLTVAIILSMGAAIVYLRLKSRKRGQHSTMIEHAELSTTNQIRTSAQLRHHNLDLDLGTARVAESGIYNCIRDSDVRATIVPPRVPAFLRRPECIVASGSNDNEYSCADAVDGGNPNEYSYADPLRLGLRYTRCPSSAIGKNATPVGGNDTNRSRLSTQCMGDHESKKSVTRGVSSTAEKQNILLDDIGLERQNSETVLLENEVYNKMDSVEHNDNAGTAILESPDPETVILENAGYNGMDNEAYTDHNDTTQGLSHDTDMLLQDNPTYNAISDGEFQAGIQCGMQNDEDTICTDNPTYLPADVLDGKTPAKIPEDEYTTCVDNPTYLQTEVVTGNSLGESHMTEDPDDDADCIDNPAYVTGATQ